MREIKSITVQGLGHWQIGDKIGDGVIYYFTFDDETQIFAAHKTGGYVISEWVNMPCMVVY